MTYHSTMTVMANPEGLAAIETHVLKYSARLAQWLNELPKPVASWRVTTCGANRSWHHAPKPGLRFPTRWLFWGWTTMMYSAN